MLVYVVKKTGIVSLALPSKITGSYWVKDYKDNGDVRELINIKEQDGKWIANSNRRVSIVFGGKKVESLVLQNYQYFVLQFKDENIEVYVSPSNDSSMKKYKYQKFEQLSVGSGNGNNIVCASQLLDEVHFRLYQKDNYWFVEDNNTRHGTFVNNNIVNGTLRLFYGDIIFAMGFKLMFFNGFIYMNSPLDTVFYDKNMFVEVPASDTIGDVQFGEVDEVIELYNESDYFVRSPMFTEVVEEKKFDIEAPPNMDSEDKTPLILTMGPMITMGMTSVVYMMSSINSLQNGGNAMTAAPMIVMSVSMLAGTVLWPILTRRYQKKEHAKKVALRDQKYGEYLIAKEKELKSLLESQKQIMLSNFLNSQDCYQYIIYLNRYLWARELNQDNFMYVRLGLGEVEPKIQINCPQERFSLEDDKLEKQMHQVIDNNRKILNAPIILSLTDRNILAITGKYQFIKPYMDTLLIQLFALQSYYDLKIVLFTNSDKMNGWEYLGLIPHLWSDDRQIRFFATNNEEGVEVSQYLSQIFESRLSAIKEGSGNSNCYKNFKEYYLIVTDDLKEVRDYSIVKKVLDNDSVNLGFGLIILHPNLSNLPSECKSFIALDNTQEGVILQRELSSETKKNFKIEHVSNIDFLLYPTKLANVPIENEDINYVFPKVLGFLEMYNVGLIDQLNVLERWRNSNPIVSLAAQVGVDESGNAFRLDLHEKVHGPHGLIAGMTGSGKSEFIITYILSMALNYHPDEVQFVLIDYKGGGLVGAFENKDTGIKLPHLAGTITNLDVADINRALASIESELKRRQHLFNVARDKLNEGTIDIYKYQKYYRDGSLDEPVSHLFIISDEFAELKDQQPDFMEQLISTARIGRSLGVHLILATQKPSGVVDDQIWSNSRFRVCLKVQDSTDSNEMIRKPDAASLKDAGRFYLQVGYDEFFALGQAAWAGSKYIPQEKVYHDVDDSIAFVDNVGKSYKTLRPPKNVNTVSHGEELPNIVNYLNNISLQEGINVKKLWLDKIPGIIYVDNLKKKYNFQRENYHIKPIIGEYDNPSAQSQGLVVIDFELAGNTVIYSVNDKSLILNSLVYSLISTYSSEEVNIYIIDMDTETFKLYKNAPQIGDVVFGNETEKIKNFFKVIMSEVSRRKKLFQNYNGSYRFYCDNSGEKLPAIVFLLTGCENFMEEFEDYGEVFAALTRDCVKYGIYCVVSAISDRAMNLRTRQNFTNIIPLKLNDEYDYRMLLGKKTPVISDIDGRGMVLVDGEPYEFQSSSICDSTQVNSYILSLCDMLNKKDTKRAPRIPVLPEVISYDDVISELRDLTSVPVGIETEGLQVATFNFKKNLISTFMSNDFPALLKFSSLIVNEISSLSEVNTIVIDCDSSCDEITFNDNVNYVKQNIDELLNNCVNMVGEKIIFVVGIESFVKSVSQDLSDCFEKLRKSGNCWFAFVDRAVNIKNYNFENWFKKNVSLYEGIWIGQGLGDVTFYSLSTSYRVINLPIKSNYGYNIDSGNATCIKIIEEGVDSDE